MGSAQSLLSPAEAAITTTVLLAGAIAFGVSCTQPSRTPLALGADSSNEGVHTTDSTGTLTNKAKKNKKKAKSVGHRSLGIVDSPVHVASTVHPSVAELEGVVTPPRIPVVPGSFTEDGGGGGSDLSAGDGASPSLSSATKRHNKKGKKKGKETEGGDAGKTVGVCSGLSGIAPSADPKQSNASLASTDTDSGWTRVESSSSPSERDQARHGDAEDGNNTQTTTTTSDIDDDDAQSRTTDDGVDSGVRVAKRTRTLAEKMLPRPRKTGVEE